MFQLLKIYLLIATLIPVVGDNIFLKDYGAYVHGEKNVSCAQDNGRSLYQALTDSKEGDQIILDQGETMYYIPYTSEGVEPYYSQLENITFIFDGTLILHNNISAWPMKSDDEYINAIDIRNSNNIIITGKGTIDGQGFSWWSDFLHGLIPRKRPTLIQIQDSTNILIEHLSLLNSPRFNIYADNVLHFKSQYLTIWVDTQKQQQISKTLSSFMFPFNTDGIDVIGQDIHLSHLNISNYDDSVAIKPSRISNLPLENRTMNCSQDILVEKVNIFRGVGLSIGSVSSSEQNCVRNVLFRDIHANQPLKLIYIKTGSINGATQAQALIENITYSNIIATNSLMYPIYIGPQQQKEPDGTGDGFWPPINPYVTIRNISIVNVKLTKSHSYPGIIRCNISNPCTNIIFKNTSIDTNRVLRNRKKYICSEVGSIQGLYDSMTTPELENCGLVSKKKDIHSNK